MDSHFTSQGHSPGHHFPFVGLLAILIALSTANILQTLNLIQQRANLQDISGRADTMVPEAKVLQSQIEPRLELFSRDLVQMASTNESARQLVQQFGITWTPTSSSDTNRAAASAQPAPDGKARR